MKSLCGKQREDPKFACPGQVFWALSVLPTFQTTDHERFTIRYYKIIKSHGPTKMNETESSFNFAIKHQQNPDDNIWYRKSF